MEAFGVMVKKSQRPGSLRTEPRALTVGAETGMDVTASAPSD